MPDQKPDAEAALRKLGKRLRDVHAAQHPAPENCLDIVESVVREQYEQRQKAQRAPNPAKDREKKPPEADEGR